MGSFTSEEMYRFVGGTMEEALAEPSIRDKWAEMGIVIYATFTDPESILLIDPQNEKVLYGADAVQFRRTHFDRPVVEFVLPCAIGHRFFLGEVNLPLAVSKGEVKAKGPVKKIFRVAPTLKPLFPRYREKLLKAGRHDLVGAA